MSDSDSKDVPASDDDKAMVPYSNDETALISHSDNQVEVMPSEKRKKPKGQSRNSRKTGVYRSHDDPDADGRSEISPGSSISQQGTAAKYYGVFPDARGYPAGWHPSQVPHPEIAQHAPWFAAQAHFPPGQFPPPVTSSSPYPPSYAGPVPTSLPTHPGSFNQAYMPQGVPFYSGQQHLDAMKAGLYRDQWMAQQRERRKLYEDHRESRPTVEVGTSSAFLKGEERDGSPRGSRSSNPYQEFGSARLARRSRPPIEGVFHRNSAPDLNSGAGSGTLVSEQSGSGGRRVLRSPTVPMSVDPSRETTEQKIQRLARHTEPTADRRERQGPPRHKDRRTEEDDYSSEAEEEYAEFPSAGSGGRSRPARMRRTVPDVSGRGPIAEPPRPTPARSHTWESSADYQPLLDRGLQSSPVADHGDYVLHDSRPVANTRRIPQDEDIPSDTSSQTPSPTRTEDMYFKIPDEEEPPYNRSRSSAARAIPPKTGSRPMSHSETEGQYSEDEGSRSGSDYPSGCSDDPFNDEDTLQGSERPRRLKRTYGADPELTAGDSYSRTRHSTRDSRYRSRRD